MRCHRLCGMSDVYLNSIIEYPGLMPVQFKVPRADKCSQLCLQVSADLLATIDKLFDSIDPWLWRSWLAALGVVSQSVK